MNHLTPDELIDAVDGTLDPVRETHLTGCAACGRDAARLRATLLEARAVDMPEPSPLFWDHLSMRVRAAIAVEETPRRGWTPDWLRWPVLAPLAALALLVLALTSTVARAPSTSTSPADANAAAVPAVDLGAIGEAEWAVVTEIVGPVALDDARDAGIVVNPGDAERAALELDADEQRELVRLIKEEMDKAGD